VSDSGISWAICKSAPRSRQIAMLASTTQFFTGRMPFLSPNHHCQGTEGIVKIHPAVLLWFQVHQACTGVPEKGLFYPPTLITGVQTVSRVVMEEVRAIFYKITCQATLFEISSFFF